ncbi:MAG TPA: site-specific integrase [Chthoniobacteraceae bacterium]|nr:site-specific integrase [Chthoniobacteraceae bacterium]
MICTVFKPKRIKDGKTVVARLYRGRYRLDGERVMRDVPLNTPDKRVAQQRLEEIVKRKQMEAEGMIPPESIREASAMPLKKLLSEYLADLQALGRSFDYVYIVEKQIVRLAKECRWATLKDVTAASFSRWRAGQRKAAKTLNEYLTIMKAFLNWLERHEKLTSSPLKCVEKVQQAGRQVRKRRALTAEEMTRLLSVAGQRRPVYLAAVYTGLRRGELKALEWGDVRLDGEKPFLLVRASTTKNRKDATMMIHPDLLAELRAMRPSDAAAHQKVFEDLLPNMDQFRRDLAKAKIEFINERGLRADFHSLRHTLATNLALAGTAPRVAMEVMRHSDIRLTANVYTDAGLLPVSDAVTKLPSFGEKSDPPAALVDSQDSPIDSQKMFRTSHAGSGPVPGCEFSEFSQTLENQGLPPVLSGSVKPGPEIGIGCLTRTRT